MQAPSCFAVFVEKWLRGVRFSFWVDRASHLQNRLCFISRVGRARCHDVATSANRQLGAVKLLPHPTGKCKPLSLKAEILDAKP